MFDAGDPGFVGPAYQGAMILQDAESCINYYIEIAEVKGAKMPIALLGTPGLNTVMTGNTSGVRGMWVLPGDTQMLVVIANSVYVASITTAATSTSIPVFSLGPVIGTLLTTTGPVSIRDNGQVFGGEGGYVVIVDGQYGYYYSLTGTSQVITFTGGVTSGDAYITVGSIPHGLVVTPNAIVTDTAGYIPTESVVLYTGTVTAAYFSNTTGYFTFLGATFGSISPTTDSNSNTISGITQSEGNVSLAINSASSLTQAYFAQLTVNSNTLYSGDAAFSFSGGVNVWTWSGTTVGMVAGNTYAMSYGNSGGVTYFTGADFNAVQLNISNNATGTNSADTISIQIPIFGQITDPAFLAASQVAFIEGWLLFSEPNTRTFFTNATTPYTLLFSGLFYALKDSSTDNLVGLYENSREAWLFGERTSEIWYNAGGGAFAFQRQPGIGLQVGCAAQFSIARLGENLIWLARNEQGQNIIAQQVQYSWERVSNHAIEHAIAQYPVVSDAIGYTYEEQGHFFYVLTFPTADVTWVYDATASGNYQHPVWHQRASLDAQGVWHRHRSNCATNFANVRLVGDYQNGNIYQMSRQFYSDAGATLKAQRRSPHEWAKTSRKRVFFSELQLEFTPGVGLQSGQGSDPKCMLRWSSDGGFNWSNEVWLSLGAAGQTRNRAIARLLGYARDRVWEINVSDPVPRDLIGATVYAEEGI